MTQYKDKAQKKENLSDVPLGLFSYPVLMAADILLYQAAVVPVGEDQLQHLELARDIAKRFNHKYCQKSDSKVFVPPRAVVVDHGSRVMSLTDGKTKMSKSAKCDYSRINLLDPPDLIAAKIKKCKTDSISNLIISGEDRPEFTNLVGIYQALTNKSAEEIKKELESLSWGPFKALLTEAIVEELLPIQNKYRDIMSDELYLHGVLEDGRRHANEIANETLLHAKKAMGFNIPNY